MQIQKIRNKSMADEALNEACMGRSILYSYTPETHPYIIFLEDLSLAMGESGKKIIYITSNRPASFVANMVKARGGKVKDIFFIDAVSNLVKIRETRENFVYINSPADLDSLSISFASLVESLKDCVVVIDSISTFLIYNNATYLLKFLDYAINLCRKMKVGMVIISTEKDLMQDHLDVVLQKVDKIIKCCSEDRLGEVKEELGKVKQMREDASNNYYKRRISEESFKKIINELDKKMIELEVELGNLKKSRKS